MAIVTVAQLAVEIVNLVLPIMATARAIGEYAVRSAVYVGPNNVNVVVVNQVLPTDVSLEANRTFDGSELILDLHQVIVNYHAFASRVSNPVWLTKTDIKL
ncbi:hypothetical protein ColKHC_08600 [Colletotrichum higginsianum]|nr:hypothetical protein ColKHC_08600 [Colletotrichum higginsianum]